jgi:hypothetical protein
LSSKVIPSPYPPRRFRRLTSLITDLGLIASLALLVLIPVAAFRLSAAAVQGLRAGAEQAQSLADSLMGIADSLGTAAGLIDSASISIAALDQTLEDSGPVIDGISAMLVTQTPDTLEASRQALLAAQTGAQAMDSVLRGLALLGGPPYDPQHSLASSLGAVASDLEPLPEALRKAGGNLGNAGRDIQAWRLTLPALSANMRDLSGELRSVGDDAGQRAASLTTLSQQLSSAAQGLPVTIGLVASLGWLVLLGLAVAQLELRRAGRLESYGGAGGLAPD